MSNLYKHRLDNGLILVAEAVPGVQSLAVAMLTPAGLAAEPAGKQGVGAMLAEMVGRGAGGMSAREHSDALDRLGVQRGTDVETHHLRFSATMIGSKLREALPLLLDMAYRPNLDEDQFEPSRDLCLQSIDSLDDEPQERSMLELRARHYADPLGRSPLGRREDLEAMTLGDVRAYWRSSCVPEGTILAVAGRFEWEALKAEVERLAGDWRGGFTPVTPGALPPRTVHHVTAESAQVHIALAYDAVAETHPESMLQRAAAAVLSGGMSGRLFTEVREKRGLCYAVYAAYSGHKDRGAVLGYAGTTAPRAKETLDVMEAELRKLSAGVSAGEFERAIVGMKSRLVMSGESTGARASAIAYDEYTRGRPRSLEEVRAEVDAVTLGALNRFLASHPPGEMTVVTIGPTPLR